jgi:hypothetical protein
MGCGEANRIKRSVPVHVPLQVTMQRRDICRECPWSTKNVKRLGRTTKGLTTKSVCRVIEERRPGKANIARGTLMPDIACPKGHWPAFPMPTGQLIQSS